MYTYTLPSSNDINVAVLNVMDNEPPLRANSLTTVRSQFYDPRMRMVRVEYTHAF